MAGEMVIGNMVARLSSDTRDFIQNMKGAGDAARKFKGDAQAVEKGGATVKNAFGGMGSAITGFLAGGALLTAGYKLAEFLRSSVVEAEAAAKAQAQLEAVIRSTGGAAGVTAQDVNDMAAELMKLTGVEDDLIVKQSAVMLTFTKVGEEIFPQAMQAALDMSAAMGQDLQSSVVQLGKALNDPIEGAGALRRVGVQLTDSQEDLIKSLVEGGRVAEAQGIILAELQTEFGGTAKAMHEAGSGSDDFANAIGNLKEAIGKGLIPAVADANSGIGLYIKSLTNRFTIENDLLEAQKLSIVTMEEFKNQLFKIDWTSYSAADAMEWLKEKTEMYNQELALLNIGSLEGQREIERLANEEKALAAATEEVAKANKAAQRTTKDWMAELDTGIDNTIANWLEQMEFMAGGGGQIQAAAEAVKQALLERKISPEQARIYWNELYVAAQALQVEMGNITAKEAAENIRKTLNVSLQEALTLLKKVNTEAAKNITKTVTINVKYSAAYLRFLAAHRQSGGPVTGGMGYVVGEAGPELFVPSVSGTIVPNSQVESFGNDGPSSTVGVYSGGDTYQEITINNYNEMAAALNAAILLNSRASRLNAGM